MMLADAIIYFMRLKIIVGGHFNAGKTTFVRTASQIISVSTERKVSSPEEKRFKDTTTTAMDYGKLSLEGKEVNIFGIPGQKRFSFMWEALTKGASGFIFLVDSTTEELWEDTLEQMDILVKESNRPYIVCANKQDLPNVKPINYVREKLGIPNNIPVVPCIAKDRDVVVEVLSAILYLIDSENVKEGA